jgi:hypothetical protein
VATQKDAPAVDARPAVVRDEVVVSVLTSGVLDLVLA